MKEKNSRNIRFEIMLESAYAMISVMPDVTVKKTPTSVSYHLVMNYGDDGMLDVLYTYDLKSQECIGVHVDSLPKKRRLSLPVKSQFGNVFIISNPGDKTEPAVVFDRDNPFKSFVVDLK